MATSIENIIGRTVVALPRIDAVAGVLIRCGLVINFGWNGLAKFTHEEALGVQALVSHSPFQAWLYNILSVDTLSALLGVAELGAATLLAIKPFAPRISVLGSLFCTTMLIFTISYLFTTPGIIESEDNGLLLLSSTGSFLLKDFVLLGGAIWTLTDAFRSGWKSPQIR